MSRTYTTTGIVLKRRDYQENDKLFSFYTSDYGKIDVLAKGTKKIVSKLNPYLEPFYYIKIMVAKGKIVDKLANVDLLKSYPNLRQDQRLVGFYILNYLVEAIDGLIIGQTLSNDKFKLLLDVLDILENEIIGLNENNKDRLLMLANIYVLKLLNLLGYQPEIRRCLVCHRGILLPKNIFDFSSGGIICEDCKRLCLIEDYIIITDKVIKILQMAKEKEFDYFVKLTLDSQTLSSFNQVVEKLIIANTERALKVVAMRSLVAL